MIPMGGLRHWASPSSNIFHIELITFFLWFTWSTEWSIPNWDVISPHDPPEFPP
jgi:hypothetical protein